VVKDAERHKNANAMRRREVEELRKAERQRNAIAMMKRREVEELRQAKRQRDVEGSGLKIRESEKENEKTNINEERMKTRF
jgi:hypothetical protein